MSPNRFGVDVDPLPKHTHKRNDDGGDLEDYARLSRTQTQTFAGALEIAGVAVTNDAGLSLENGGVLTLDDLSTTPVQSVVNGAICLDGAVAVTDARAWSRPDASGEYVMSKPTVNRTGKSANDSADILTAPEAGLYLLAWYVEITTADATGTIALSLTAVGTGGSCTQPVLPAFTMLNKTARSGLAVVWVASGDVTGAVTLATLTGTPGYDWRVAVLGRVA